MIVSTNSTPIHVSPTSRYDARSRPDAVSRSEDSDTPDQGKDKRVDRTRPEFAGLLALLAAATPTTRADALKQLPSGSASLLDRLLNGAGKGTGDSAEATLLDGGAAQSADGHNGGALSHQEAVAVMQATMATANSMRYGMMQDGSVNGAAMPTEQRQGDALTPVASKSRSRSLEESVDNVSLADAKRTLARIAEKRGVSREQLLAVGDIQGANMQAVIDALIARAGTAEGAALADRAAHAAALAAVTVTSAADVTAPIRDPNALAPELRTRLERVVSRMRDE